MTVSIVIPTLNEESTITGLLQNLEGEKPLEILVADGGSIDQTVQLASRYAEVVPCPQGRAVQMNEAARRARGDVLLFLHADVRLEPDALPRIASALANHPQVAGGNFEIRYEGDDVAARVFTIINRWRCRCGILYGDSGIFCRRSVFEELGGYREWPILEDYEFGRRLRRAGRLTLLPHSIFVSARRWRRDGMIQTLWSWFWIQTLYLAGVSPARLARLYRDIR